MSVELACQLIECTGKTSPYATHFATPDVITKTLNPAIEAFEPSLQLPSPKVLCHSKAVNPDFPAQKKKYILGSSIMQAWKATVQACKFQVHVSRSFDPFLNLSVEHYLLQNSSPKSTVLFLYVNRPCVVIGRNQNPWLEVDLNLLKEARAANDHQRGDRILANPPWKNVQLVRRRSGGGSVFHDEGNVNYCVICPTSEFTREKSAEMITMAIRELNLRARVNERHDIVLDQGSPLEEKHWPDTTDMHRTIFHPNSEDNPPLKVSGSAYKIIRQRCLHHGTCLLVSADLPKISQYLRSPSQPFIRARGVESVRSPIGNVHTETKDWTSEICNSFNKGVIKVFQELHGIKGPGYLPPLKGLAQDGEIRVDADGESVSSYVGDEFDSIDEVRDGMKELRVSEQIKDYHQGSAHMIRKQSSGWLYGQTPQFTLSSHSNAEDDRARPPLPQYFPPSVGPCFPVFMYLLLADTGSLVSDKPTYHIGTCVHQS